MATLNKDGARLYYEVEGREDAPVLVLSNSLGTTLDMWAPQMPVLLPHFRVLRYDTRGHGRSDVTPGPYSVAQLGGDVLALMDHLGIARAHFCGLSMGGMIGMWLGVHHAGRLHRLALCNTAAKIGSPDTWNPRIAKVEAEGMAPIADTVLERWFTAGFRQRAPGQVAIVRDMLLATAPAGYSANCAAVRDMDQRADIASIGVPTLVIAGTHDGSTPAADGRAVADAIPGARFVELDAAHLSNWEQGEQFNQALLAFLTA
nr:3-oxoadipate enol-lactonase [uncultured Noviherbaspirillum sp.]